tara:strand:- start:233 stop:751 length:519 start_codon:yes stop_codon:yes gene_type:complete
MANPQYGQNKADDAVDFAKNATSGNAYGTVAVAGDNTQYGAAATPMSKSLLNRTIVNGHTNGFDMWLPAVSSADAGMWLIIKFGVASGGASVIVTAATGDFLIGNCTITKATDAVANQAYFASDGTDLILTLDGTTTGGLIGSEVKLQVNKDGYWSVNGILNGSGTLANMFS